MYACASVCHAFMFSVFRWLVLLLVKTKRARARGGIRCIRVIVQADLSCVKCSNWICSYNVNCVPNSSVVMLILPHEHSVSMQ
jgi:hypothetical protein